MWLVAEESLYYAKGTDPRRGGAIPAVQMGLVWCLVAMAGGISAWEDLLMGRGPYGSTCE